MYVINAKLSVLPPQAQAGKSKTVGSLVRIRFGQRRGSGGGADVDSVRVSKRAREDSGVGRGGAERVAW